jgi:hypothetical protein
MAIQLKLKMMDDILKCLSFDTDLRQEIREKKAM